jgi:hypothetical protein
LVRFERQSAHQISQKKAPTTVSTKLFKINKIMSGQVAEPG